MKKYSLRFTQYELQVIKKLCNNSFLIPLNGSENSAITRIKNKIGKRAGDEKIPVIFRHPIKIDNSKYREFNNMFSAISISGNHRYGKSYAMIKKMIDYSGFEIIEPSDELKEAFDRINKSATWICLKEKEATDGKKDR